VYKGFTPKRVAEHEPELRKIVTDLIDAIASRGECDFVADIAAPLPMIVIAEMLGARPEDRRRFKTWSDDLAAFIGGTTQPLPTILVRAARGMFQLQRYFRHLVRRRRGRPGDDLLTALITAEEKGDALSEEELLANCVLLLAAGHETTTNLIGNGIYALLQHPKQLDSLRWEPELIESAVEELLRFDSPVQWTGRVAVGEIEIGGCRIPAGQTVAMGLGAANRDPLQFADPDRLDIRRADNRHVAFGHGIHFCLGAALARLEGQVAISTVLRRFPDLRLPEKPPEWSENFTLRGLKTLRTLVR
jgi:cytochrome P450